MQPARAPHGRLSVKLTRTTEEGIVEADAREEVRRRVDMNLLVNIDVDDLDRAIDFYSNALGLGLVRRLFDDTVAEMAGATSTIYLLLKPAATKPSACSAATRDYHRHWTPVHLDFVVEDVFSAVERAAEAGAKLEGQITSHAWGQLATMSDPFGHGFCLLQRSAAGYDAAG
jgi:predicted enzyme related to lactoylglutathione lyase